MSLRRLYSWVALSALVLSSGCCCCHSWGHRCCHQSSCSSCSACGVSGCSSCVTAGYTPGCDCGSPVMAPPLAGPLVPTPAPGPGMPIVPMQRATTMMH